MTRHTTLAELSAHFADQTPRKTALVYGARRLDHAAYPDRVQHGVGALRSAGIGAGDRIGRLGLNHPD